MLRIDISNFEEHVGEDGKVFVIYLLRLQYLEKKRGINKIWELKRRFSEFYELYLELQRIQQYEEVDLRFPNRMTLAFSRKAIAARRVPVLSKYISDIISFGPPYVPAIIDFLRLQSFCYDETAVEESNNLNLINFNNADTTTTTTSSNNNINNIASIGGGGNTGSSISDDPSSASSSPRSPRSPRPLKKETTIFSSMSKAFSQTTDKMATALNLKPKRESKKSLFTFDEVHYDDEDKRHIVKNIVQTLFGISIACVLFMTLRLVYSIFYKIAYLWSNTSTFTTTFFELLKAIFDFICISRYTLEVFIATSIFYMVIHRLLGYVVTRYLRSLLMMENGGYNMSIGWISLRLGLDRNEIIVHNFTWHNPPQFKETDYFVNVGELSISFDFMSLYYAITKGGGKSISLNERNPIKIHHLQLNHAKVYIERVHTDEYEGLNLWAALGADNSQESKDKVESGIMNSLTSAFDGASSVASAAGNAILKYNPATLLYKGAKAASEKLQEAFDSSSEDENGNGNGNGNGSSERKSKISKKKSKGNNERTDDSDNYGGDDDYAGEGDEGGDVRQTFNTEDSSVEDSDISKDWHWGIDYIFENDRITVHDLKVFAQDFINAEHSANSSTSFIDIKNLEMSRVELTKPPKKTAQRRGLYLDVMIWRLINKAIAKLVATNQLSLISTVSTGILNQTSSTLSSALSTINPMTYISAPPKNKKHVSFNGGK